MTLGRPSPCPVSQGLPDFILKSATFTPPVSVAGKEVKESTKNDKKSSLSEGVMCTPKWMFAAVTTILVIVFN